MKKYIFLLASLLICSLAAVGSDSNDTEKTVSIQVDQIELSLAPVTEINAVQAIDSPVELPTELLVFSPDLGRRSPNKSSVSESLAEGFFMSVRPPPDSKVEKSEYTIRQV